MTCKENWQLSKETVLKDYETTAVNKLYYNLSESNKELESV